MENNKFNQTLLGQSLLWFGAAVSIAEIATGMLLGNLGIKYGIIAIIFGHMIGAGILYFAGYIGAKERSVTPDVIKISLGQRGTTIFSVINIIQLVGWTSIMIINGAQAFNGISLSNADYDNAKLWCIVIGVFICFWILVGVKKLTIINAIVCMVFLLFFIIIGYRLIFETSIVKESNEAMEFGAAVELNVTMVLSWLPLISDYTSESKKPLKGTIVSVLSYSVGSILMFSIGLLAANAFQSIDISQIILKMGMGGLGLFIIVFSTVTTTYLDTYSAGVCISSIWKKISVKYAAIIVCIIGTIAAMLFPVNQLEYFLYFIGSVFAPLFAILFADYFILKKNANNKNIDITNIVIWGAGFILYRLFMELTTVIGNTLPTIMVILIIKIVFEKVKGSNMKGKEV